MPFSSLHDPSDLARAYAAMEAAWNQVVDMIPEALRQEERQRLAYIVAACAPLALDEDDLTQNALQQFRQRSRQAGALGT
ncbi:hypothetical protein [Bosea sp. BK604]|uniref:hypothetical protein n=1 Tax=Bosea sp. BK604 TaxID=2512180 RepID=UPI00104AB76A|nr:hypothetical protein [Bosea sp. BK604]